MSKAASLLCTLRRRRVTASEIIRLTGCTNPADLIDEGAT